MTNPGQSQKRSLECLRLESECRELAVRAGNPALRKHFDRMAQVWNDLAHQDLALAADPPASEIYAA